MQFLNYPGKALRAVHRMQPAAGLHAIVLPLSTVAYTC